MSTNAKTNLEIILRVFAQELGDTLFFDVAYRSFLGLLVQGGLQTVLGPVGFSLPLVDVVTLLTKVGYKSILELKRATVSGTAYTLRPGKSGNLIAENTKPSSLSDLPLELPERYEIPLDRLWIPDECTSRFSPIIDSSPKEIYTSLGLGEYTLISSKDSTFDDYLLHQLHRYVKEEQRRGRPDAHIRDDLIQAGNKEHLVSLALSNKVLSDFDQIMLRQLHRYVKEEQRRGRPDADIQDDLIQAGNKENLVSLAFSIEDQ